MKRKNVAMLSVMLVMALLVSGCGGGGAETTATHLSRARFLKEANSICKQAKRKRGAAIFRAIAKLRSASGSSPPEQEKVIAEAALPSYRKMIVEIKNLPAPRGDKEQVRAIVKAFEGGADSIEANPARALADERLFARANLLASGYGLDGCVT